MPDLQNLDMTDVEAKTGGPLLMPGCYLTDIAAAEYINKSTTHAFIKVTFEDTEGHGSISNNYNVFHSSDEARRISREQLKTLLTFAGHPNPDRPTDLDKYLGLRVKIIVKADGTYVDKHGEMRNSYTVKRVMSADNPLQTGPDVSENKFTKDTSGGYQSHAAPNDMDDEIPF